ncbi:MAG: Crp/Fnr family transcriptional regulator [Variovorax sp.]|nr:Crp/Fnr family transcriptional regulator [Variovorax sp.]
MTDTDRSTLALRRIALLHDLPEERLDALARQCVWKTIDAQQRLMARDDDRQEVYFLVSGSVRVTTYSAQGRQVTFRDCEAGAVIGDLAAIDGLPRSADVMTLEASVVASLDRNTFLKLLRAEPQLAERMMKRLALLVRQLTERVVDVSTLGVQGRLHLELVRLARLAGVTNNVARLAPAPRHAALASQISTTREQVTRELNALVRSGILIKELNALVIADMARLTAQAAPARDGAG